MEEKRNNTSASRKGRGKTRNSLAAQQAQRIREERLRQEKIAQEKEKHEREALRNSQEKTELEPEKRRPQASETRPPQKRDSRAAQTAKRRKEERMERWQMDGLREKQIRQAKRRTRKRISRTTWRRIFIMGGIVLAIILSMLIFFRVQHITVQGSQYYSQQNILEASGIAEGDNLLMVSREKISGNILAKLPLVRSVQVNIQLPDMIIITVTEDAATYAVQDTVGDWYLITAIGKVVQKIDAKDQSNYLFVKDLIIKTPTLGEHAAISAPKGKEVAAQAQMDSLLALLTMLGDPNFSDLTAKVVFASVPSSHKLSISYDNRFTVELGDGTELEYKLAYLKRVLAEQKDYTTGTIDLTLSEGKIARVMLDD